MNNQKFVFNFRVFGGALLRFFRFSRAFGMTIAARLYWNDMQKLLAKDKEMRYKAFAKRHELIESYLKQNGYDSDDMENCNDDGNEKEPAPIWICWWQGENDAPPMVKRCIESIKLHSNNHPVQMITFDNFRQFVDIDEPIVEKVRKGLFKLAHFADLVRFKLLAKYGGLWLDSTIYLTKDIDEGYFHQLFSVKTLPIDNDSVSEYRWCTFVLGGGNQFKNIYSQLSRMLERYMMENDVFIDYLLIDYFIDILYKDTSIVKAIIDGIPYSQPYMHNLRLFFKEPFDENKWHEMLDINTIYKLTYKGSPTEYDKSGNLTFYGKILQITPS